MFFNGCLAYRNLAAKIQQERGYIYLSLDDEKDLHISLSLNITQATVLAKGLCALLPNIKVKDLMESKNDGLHGDITLTASLPDKQATKHAAV